MRQRRILLDCTQSIRMGESHKVGLLKKAVLAKSRASLWASAKKEWELIYLFEQSNGTCTCTHHPILEHCVIKNKFNHETLGYDGATRSKPRARPPDPSVHHRSRSRAPHQPPVAWEGATLLFCFVLFCFFLFFFIFVLRRPHLLGTRGGSAAEAWDSCGAYTLSLTAHGAWEPYMRTVVHLVMRRGTAWGSHTEGSCDHPVGAAV